MASTTEWTVRPLRPGDRAAILELHERVFGSALSPDQWDWQFTDNPFSRPVVWLAENTRGEIVGHYCQVPVPFWRAGSTELGGYSILSMVHPDYQRQGMLRALAKSAEEQLSEDSVRMGATFLNDNSYPVYTKRLGWREVEGELPVYYTVLDAGEVLKRYVRLGIVARVAGTLATPFVRLLFRSSRVRAGSMITVREAKLFDERVDLLWERVRGAVRYATDRRQDYLNWRIVDCPRRYTIHIAEEAAELLGLVVTREDERFGQRFGYVVELMFASERPDAGSLLIERAKEQLRREGCGLVTAIALEPEATRNALAKAGFRRLPARLMPHEIHFCARDRTPDVSSEGLTSPANWFISWSDHDVV